MEIWKPVKGYENHYEVSNKGRIRSLDRVILFKDGKTRKFCGKILALRTTNNSGYITVGLHDAGKQKRFLCIELWLKHLLKIPMAIQR